MQYKAVPFHADIRQQDGAQGVAKRLESVINEHAAQGWEYMHIATVSYSVQAGCLAGLFGAKATMGQLETIMFRKP